MSKEINKIKWQCRRGLRELDIILNGFVEFDYPNLSKQQKKEFQILIDNEDVDLMNWLVSGVKHDNFKQQAIVNLIKDSHDKRY